MSPCPLCGRKPWYEVEQFWEPEFEVWNFVECSGCWARTLSYPDDVRAGEDWEAGRVLKCEEV